MALTFQAISGPGLFHRGMIARFGLPLALAGVILGDHRVHAITDIPPGGMVWLQGYDLNPTTPGFQNSGLLRIEAVDDALAIALIVAPGKLTNAASGVINLTYGAGGSRGIYGDILNHGTFNAYTSVGFSKPDATFDNYGAFNVAPNAYAVFFGEGQVFNQYAGKLEPDLGLYLFDGTFNYIGGEVGGTPYLVNSTLRLTDLTNSVRFAMTGEKAKIEGNLLPRQAVRLQGSHYGDALMNVEEGFSNNGTLELSSIEGPWNISVLVKEGTFTNDLEGRIEVSAGTGGTREIVGDLRNRGIVQVDYDLHLSKTNGVYINEGSILVRTNATLTISNELLQIAGETKLDQGSLTIPVLDLKGGALTGHGSITGTVLNASVIKIFPGERLEIVGSYTQATTGVLEVNLAPPQAEPKVQPIHISGPGSVGGELRATLGEGYTPALGDSFTVVTGESLTGVFNTRSLPPLPNAWQWTIDYFPDRVDLRVGRTLLPVTVANDPKAKSLRVMIRSSPNDGITIESSPNLVDWTHVKTVRPFPGFTEILEGYALSAGAKFFRAHPAE